MKTIPYKRLSAFYFWYYGLLGILNPFWPIFLTDRRFTPGEIGLLLAIQMGTRIVSPNLWGLVADATGRRLGTIRTGAALACFFFAGLFAGDSFALMALVMAGYSFFWNAIMPPFEALTLDHLNRQPERYSHVRLWGSVGFIAAVMAGGAWFQNHVEQFPAAGLGVLVMIWVASMVVPAPAGGRAERKSRPLGRILRQPPVRAFLVVSCLLQIGHGIYYAFFSLQLETAGYGSAAIGAFWAVGVVAEIVLFLVMHRMMTNWSLWGLMIASLSLTVLRWLLIAGFSHSVPVLVVAQSLHAFSFGACHAVSIEYIRRFFPPQNRVQGQAIYTAASFGLGGALGSLLGGAIWTFSPDLTFRVAALVTAIAVYIAYRGLDHRGTGRVSGLSIER